MAAPFYIQRGEMRNQKGLVLTVFQFWLKFGCSRLSLTIGATDLSCATSVFDQVAACGFGLRQKMCRHGANTAVQKKPLTFLIEQEALKGPVIIYLGGGGGGKRKHANV